MRAIRLGDEQCVEVVGLLAPLLYMSWVWWKASLTVWDGLVLTLLYAAYLLVVSKVPPQEAEGIEDIGPGGCEIP